LLNCKKSVCIIGNSGIDIAGIPDEKIRFKDSNPGKIKLTLGGVGRNIAENLVRLDIKVNLITALGEDKFGEKIKKSCKDLNINLDIISSKRTSSYIYIQDEKGEMQIAISDSNVYNNITCNVLKSRLEVINNSSACVLEANLSEEVINFLKDNIKVPIFFDTVSGKKSEKVINSVNNFFCIKPNLLEAESLSGVKITGEESLKLASKEILKRNINWVFISLGSKGVWFADKEKSGFLKNFNIKLVNSTGAGDSFLSGVIWAYINNKNIKEAALAGLSASALCISSEYTVNKNLNIKILNNLIKNYKNNDFFYFF